MEKHNTARPASGIVAPLFQHPDGPLIDFDDWTLTITDEDDQRASMPIGPLGLIALGELLTAIGKNREFHGC